MSLLDQYLSVRITSAEPERLLSMLTDSGINLTQISPVDQLSFDVRINRSKFAQLEKLMEKYGSSYKVLQRQGTLWYLENMWKRPVLLVGIVLFLCFSFFLSGRIFFVTVSGNQTVSDKLVIAQAEKCGIKFGAKASQVRSEEVKNQLLDQLPQLQWIGVTTHGTVANIQVKERSAKETEQQTENAVCSIVAARDGVITSQTIYSGNSLVTVGESVKKGDVLVSGYTEYDNFLKAEQANAEVFAYTLRENQVISPLPSAIRTENTGKRTCYKLHIGKKVINLCNHSGILGGGCVKIYLEEYWTLPGGFRIPVYIEIVKCLFYDQVVTQSMDDASFDWLPQFSRDYLKSQMIAGEILKEEIAYSVFDNACLLAGIYACHEMIGQVKNEEIMLRNAEDN